MENDYIVQLAMDRRIITSVQLENAKAEQKLLADRGVELSLWFMLQELGYVSDDQHRELRRYMSSSRLRALEVDGYVIQGRIGSGGMGDVFRGRNAAGEEVAIKLLAQRYCQHREYAKRFIRESKATLRLNHAHITHSISAGEIEGQRYLIMELVAGKSLKQRIASEGPMPESEAFHLMMQIALALRYAWQHGVLHRDVKPANIILGPPRAGIAEPFCAKICDFGLAKTTRVSDEGTAAISRGNLTQSGVALGTPHYMSPEQASGDHDLDQRSDIYGLGATLYHTLLGQTLYTGKNSAAIMYKQVTEAFDLEPLVEGGISPPMTKLLASMLAKSRSNRMHDWDALIEAAHVIDPNTMAVTVGAAPSLRISEFAMQPVELENPPPQAVAVVSPEPRQSWLLMAVIGAAATILVAATLVVLVVTVGG